MDDWQRPLAEDGPTPLWFQIAERLRHAVESGTFAPGETLPSEAQLNRHFGVSRATSRAALNELESAGLIVRRSGKGSIVLRKRVDQPAEEMAGFSEDMRRRGLTPSYRVLEIGHEPATAEAAEALELAPGTAVFRSHRLLLADGEPIGTAMSWLPPRLFRTQPYPTSEELETGSLYAWLRVNCGVTVKRAREYIEATSTESSLAEKLGVRKGFPLLVARRQSFDEQDKPAECVILSFRSDRYRFHLEVRR
ncbi:GntR family transcriptional regulator [Tranquillimonas alkanivorans]|uniref:Transcriptional regulator, GntR family n=1 Tax=Tranquillimonas alkanivorans TaxID=441119 RepID=A0A1I5V7D6_9RHOB|nr:GntR family transcriptional regulator [Tranquillimonas alkanivorans]SFQ03444.1 transcriptional regulator, GntR family [Tranquillimonas alkanivorans]